MRLKDIAPLRAVIKKVSFVRNEADEWEIHFAIGEEKDTNHAVTLHYPSEEPRSWKSLDNALKAAEEIFDPKINQFTINLKKGKK